MIRPELTVESADFLRDKQIVMSVAINRKERNVFIYRQNLLR
jgi:hypothetical protein